MASAFSHAFVAVALGKSSLPSPLAKRTLLLGMICSIAPDADVIGFRFGIEYGHAFGHRGFTHSFLFAALLAGLATAVAARYTGPSFPRLRLFVYFFAATVSHGMLDAATDGGLGIAFFAPFDNTRYFLPWRPLVVSPIGAGAFFSAWGLRVILSELIWIWLPIALVGTLVALLRSDKQAKRRPSRSTATQQRNQRPR